MEKDLSLTYRTSVYDMAMGSSFPCALLSPRDQPKNSATSFIIWILDRSYLQPAEKLLISTASRTTSSLFIITYEDSSPEIQEIYCGCNPDRQRGKSGHIVHICGWRAKKRQHQHKQHVQGPSPTLLVVQGTNAWHRGGSWRDHTSKSPHAKATSKICIL